MTEDFVKSIKSTTCSQNIRFKNCLKIVLKLTKTLTKKAGMKTLLNE